SGTPLTRELEEELAVEAAGGYDLHAATRKLIGRPSLDRGISPRLDLRVEPDLARALHNRAEEEHRSVSAVAREALRRYLAS
ncbi:MAG: ribbon-helix-helix protein, CopG family, partial [Acidimicrobiales bacterium]